MVHEMKLKSKYFDLIRKGAKIYEGRLNDEKRKLISVGDIITFKKEPDLIESFDALVQELIYFDTFDEMVTILPLKQVGFATEKPNEVVDVYHQFYSIEDEKRYGVVAIKVEVIK